MLSGKSCGQNIFVKSLLEKIVIGQPLAREDSPAIIDQGQYDGLRQTFVFGLDMVSHALEFYVCIVAGDHVING